MSTFDQSFGAQAGRDVAYATNAALALSRQVADRQRQLAQELRTPVVVEVPAKRSEEKQPGDAEKERYLSPTKSTDEAGVGGAGGKGGGGKGEGRLVDVRI